MRSSSSVSSATTSQKWREAKTLLKWYSNLGDSLEGMNLMLQELDVYRSTYERYTGRHFASARAFEIGYGARPFQLIALISMGLDAQGIDLDMPMIRFNPLRIIEIARRNGVERALKTCARSLLFDRREKVKLGRALAQRGYSIKIDPSRFFVGDAATYNFGPEPLDLVYSTDVFEHIPLDGLEILLARLAAQASSQSLLLITVNIFTGITGGHLTEWYRHVVDSDAPKLSEPWEHLRKRRFAPNTYLNGLSRAAYRNLFSRRFEILDEWVIDPALGHRWLTPEVRAELSDWSEEELFSNRVMFTLRPRAAAQPGA